MIVSLICATCKTEFQHNAQGGFRPERCPPCRLARKRETDRAKAKRWREANPEKARDQMNKSNRKRLADPAHLEQKRNDYNRRHYGLTPEDIAQMRADQLDLCAICNGEHIGPGNRLHIDHDHETGKVRALLCARCDTLLGLAHHDATRLRSAADYLDKHK